MLKRMLAILIAVSALSPTAAEALEPDIRTVRITQDVLGSVEVLAPPGEPSRFVIFLSDKDGLTAESVAKAKSLTARGAAVALIDLPKINAIFAKRTNDSCYYIFGELEDLGRNAQRQLGVSDWQWPTLFGIGQGGTLAYLLLAQAPANTVMGAVSVGFAPSFPGVTPLCEGAPEDTAEDGMITYGPRDDLPANWIAVLEAAPSETVSPFFANRNNTSAQVVPGDGNARFEAAIEALLTLKPPARQALSDLPLTELPAKGGSGDLVILLSGDGGWRDIDKEIGEYLAARGVSVIGLDSLRYFWRRKEPKEIGRDLRRIVDHYLEAWNTTSVALAGYSFGADVLPMTWPELDPKTQERTKLIALLGVEPTFDLEVSVSGWLGVASSSNIDIRPYLKQLPKEKVMCVYGIEEKEDDSTACGLPEMNGATLVERPGGHHFDGNYEAIADMILQRLRATALQDP